MNAVRRQPKPLTSKERASQRFRNIAVILTKTDRIVSGDRNLSVRVDEVPTKVPGWSDGRTITINRSVFPNIGDVKTLVRISGLNYHELAHCLFTPRMSTTNHKSLVNMIRAEGIFSAFNSLEDQRIETLFTAQYRSAAKYFSEMVVGFLMEDEQTWPTAALLTHGRRFLPLALREAFEQKFEGSADQLRRGQDIIDEYRVLNVLANETRALALVRAFHKLIQELSATLPPTHGEKGKEDETGCAVNNNQGVPDREQSRQAAESAKEQTEQQDELEAEGQDGSGFYDDVKDDLSDAQDEMEGAGEDGSGGGDDSEEPEEGDDSDGSGGDDQGDSDDDSLGERPKPSGDSGDSEDSEGGSAGTGSGTDEPLSDDELAAMLDDAMSDILGSETVKNETRSLKSAAGSDMPMDEADKGDKNMLNHERAHDALLRTSSSVEREISRLRAQMEPGWERGATSGRLNVQLAMNAEIGDEDIFDHWDEGQEFNAGLEVVILLDRSGSMGRGYGYTGPAGQEPIVKACEAMWVLKRAMEDQEAHVTVLAFNDSYVELFGRTEKVDRAKVPYISARGGTTPIGALKRARSILAASPLPNRLLVITSDGDWSMYEDPTDRKGPHEVIREMPATTLFIGIGNGVNVGTTHECDMSAHVDDPSELVPVIRQTVTRMLRSRIGEH